MGRHGDDQPPVRLLQQPGARRRAGAAVRGISRSRILPLLCEQRPADFRSGLAAMSENRTRMMRSLLLISGLLLAASAPAFAASEADFKSAYAAAAAAEKEADAIRDQWTTAEAALKAARKAADAGNFDQAIAAAKQAEALAKAAIFQAASEKDRWKDAEVR